MSFKRWYDDLQRNHEARRRKAKERHESFKRKAAEAQERHAAAKESAKERANARHEAVKHKYREGGEWDMRNRERQAKLRKVARQCLATGFVLVVIAVILALATGLIS